jgi:two-component system, LuxR family, response regulator FixJ
MAERTVYILDDDEAVLRSLGRLLSSAGFEAIAFDRPDAFLAAAKVFKRVAYCWTSACPA